MGEPPYLRVAPAINNRIAAVPIANNPHMAAATAGEYSHAANAAHGSALAAAKPSTSQVQGTDVAVEDFKGEVASAAEASRTSGCP
ncbi:MAG: hypothetical protein KGL39_56275 [Patescibacteria group bacterium]|nr:hypothetical protein [Patescibacteria group bacterium]